MVWVGRILLILSSTITVVSGSAKGVKFLVAFLSNGAGSSDLQLIITNTNDKERAFVVVSSAVNSTMLAENVVQSQSFVELAVTNTYRMDTNGSNDKAILVTSSIPVLVTAKNSESASTDKFLVIPVKNLGKRHVVLTYHDEKYMSEFALVATKNHTVVNITYPTGEATSLHLEQYESYREQSEGSDLTGTRILSTHPVAMFAGGMTTNSRKMLVGHIAEQLLSVEYWGRSFLTSPMSEQGDFLKLIGYNETTAVRIWRNSTDEYEFHTLYPFESLVIDMGAKGDDHFLVEANDTVLVGQFSLTNSPNSKSMNLGYTLVLPNEQFLSSYKIVSTYNMFGAQYMYVRIVARNDQEWLNQYPFQTSLEPAFTSYQTAIQRLETGQQEFFGHQAFGLNLYDISFNDASSQLVNLRLEVQTENCVLTQLVQSDNFDNDCDGKVDEEMMDGVDNDGDRVTDEDTNGMLPNITQANMSVTESSNATTPRYRLGSSTHFISTIASKSTTKITQESSTGSPSDTGGTSNNNGGETQGNQPRSPTATASDDPTTENPTQKETSDDGLREQSPTVTDTAVHSDTSVTGNVVQDATITNHDVPHDGSVTGNPAHQHDMTTANLDVPHGGSVTGNPAQHHDMTTVNHDVPHGGSVTGNPAQDSQTTLDHDVSHDGSVTGNPTQPDKTTLDHAAERETPAADTQPPRDMTPSEDMTPPREMTPPRDMTPTRDMTLPRDMTSPDDMRKEMTSVEDAVKQKTTNAPNVKHEDTKGPGNQKELTTAKEAVDNPKEPATTKSSPDPTSGTNIGKSGVQSASNVDPAVQKESPDDIGILTIVAPSFICGVPFLIIVLCCIRSIMAGVCRKKVYPKEKKCYPHIQSIYKG